jgi:16S rRNA (guanine966-N2)-methyltransferase
VREALFSMLTSRLGTLEGLHLLDGFAGTGALGLEALSRGAAHCTFVESDMAAARVLAANVAKLGAGPRARLLTMRIEQLGRAETPIDLVLLDPPYAMGLAAAALDRLGKQGWLGPATLVSVETGKGEILSAEGFTRLVDRHHGKARLHLLQPGLA